VPGQPYEQKYVGAARSQYGAEPVRFFCINTTMVQKPRPTEKGDILSYAISGLKKFEYCAALKPKSVSFRNAFPKIKRSTANGKA